jgi:hypothetical protein
VAKTSGLGDHFSLGGVDLSGDIGALSRIGGGLAGTQDVTDITQSGMDRVGLHRDGGIDFAGYFNPTGSHPTLSTLPTGDVICTYHRGAAIGNAAASLVAKQANYDWTRAADGSLTTAVQTLANGYGLEWGKQLTAWQRADTAATNGASLDGTAATTQGAQAWLHVFAFTGTDVTISIEDSANDSAFAAVAGLSFTQVTAAPFSQRLATAAGATLRRYVRAVTATSGGFTSAVFSIQVTRNQTSVIF